MWNVFLPYFFGRMGQLEPPSKKRKFQSDPGPGNHVSVKF